MITSGRWLPAVALGSNGLEHVQPAQAWHLDVQHHGVGVCAFEQGQCLRTIGRRGHDLGAGLGQQFGHSQGHLGRVIRHQHGRFATGVHVAQLACGRSSCL
jgi:hypothetical protein